MLLYLFLLFYQYVKDRFLVVCGVLVRLTFNALLSTVNCIIIHRKCSTGKKLQLPLNPLKGTLPQCHFSISLRPLPLEGDRGGRQLLQKGGVPAAPSGTATLLRLSPGHQFYPGTSLAVTYFRYPRLPWLDGRCVQGPGTYSPRHG